MSIRITSGWSVAASSMTSSPVVASPATSKSGEALSSAASPWRKRGWSSAISTRTGSMMLLLRYWQQGVDAGAASIVLFNDARTTQFRRALAHREQPHTRLVFQGQSDAIVGNLNFQRVTQ